MSRLYPIWRPDCQGKQDYDGEIAGVATRYWPPNYRKDGQHSAHCSVFAGPGGSVSCEFVGPTEAYVKRQVETWVTERQNVIAAALGIDK